MRKSRPLLLLIALALPAQGAEDPEIRFNRDIRPILSDKCFFCHGTDPNTREGDLRLDLREAAMEGGAIVPGKPGRSSLIDRIHSRDPDDLMPPADSHKSLDAPEKDILEQWITGGAEYEPTKPISEILT